MRRMASLPRAGSARAFWREKSGASAIEFALVAPILMFLFLAATDLAMARRARMQLTDAGLAAERYAALKGWDAAGIENAAKNATSLPVTVTSESYCACVAASALSRATCGATCSSGKPAGTYVSAVVNASYKPMFPFQWNTLLLGGFLNMSVTNIARIK